MEPARFEGAFRVRYERAGAVTGVPRVGLEYTDRYRALVVAPGKLNSTDGIYGIRFAHNTEATVTGFGLTKQ